MKANSYSLVLATSTNKSLSTEQETVDRIEPLF